MYLKLAWRNIWRNKRRTVITLSSIGFAVFFASVMQSMQRGTYERMIDNTVRFSTGHLQIHGSGYWEEKVIDKSMSWNGTTEIKELITGLEAVEAMAPRLESFALGAHQDKTKGVIVVGVDPEKELGITRLNEKVVEGTYFERKGGVLIGKDLARFLKAGLGDTLILIGQGYHGVNAVGQFPITGILKFPNPEYNRQAVFLRLPDAQYFYGAEERITSLSILLSEASEMPIIQALLSESLDTKSYEVMSWEEMMPELVQSIELDYYSGLIMTYVLYAVIAFGIFGTFLMMTRERVYEFGILVSIGMKKLKLQLMVALEILMLTFLGVLTGILASMPIILYLYMNPIVVTGEMAETYENFGFEPILPFSIDPTIFMDQGLVVLIIALLLGIYPMSAIQSLKIVKALKE